MWDNLLQSIGNFVTGHGFQNNQSRASQDARTVRTTTTTIATPRQVATVRQTAQNNLQNLNPFSTTEITAPSIPSTKLNLSTTPVAQSTTPSFNILKNQQNTPTKGVDQNTWNKLSPQAKTNLWNTQNNAKASEVGIRDILTEPIKAAGEVVVQPLLSTPETLVRTIGSAVTGKDLSLDINTLDKNDPRRFLYGSGGAPTNWKMAGDITSTVGLGRDNPASAILGTGLTALDLIPLWSKAKTGLKSLVESTAKNAEKSAAEKIAERDALNMAEQTVKKPVAEGVVKTIAKDEAITPNISKEISNVPAKPQNVVALDRGGSISAPVRQETKPTTITAQPITNEVQSIQKQIETQPVQVAEPQVATNEAVQLPVEQLSKEAPATVPVDANGQVITSDADNKLGSIARNNVDSIQSQEEANAIGSSIYQAFDSEAQSLGTNAETILRKYWEGDESTKLMTPAERELYGRLTKEYDYVRSYGLSNGGNIDMSAARAEYSPAQSKGTEQVEWGSGNRPVFDSKRKVKWTGEAADVSDAPTRNYLTAYSEPFNRLKTITDKDGNAPFGNTDFGPEATKSLTDKQKIVADKFDDVDNLNREFESLDGDVEKQSAVLTKMENANKEAQAAYLDAMKEQIRIGKKFAKTPEQKMAVEVLAKQERGYRQGFIQLNMLFNPGTISANLIARPIISGVNRTARRLGGDFITNKVLSKGKFAPTTPQTTVGKFVANQFMKENGGIIQETKRNWAASGADLTSTGEKIAGLPGRVGGAIMELGDPKGLTYRNTVNQMVAELEHSGIDPRNLQAELRRSIGSKRWNEIYAQNEYYNNVLVGMTGDISKTKGKSVANVAVAVDKYIRENVFTLPGVKQLPVAVKENILQLFSKGLAGYIVPTLRIAQEGLSSATVGIPRIASAISKISKATSQAEASAATTQLQNGIRDAMVGAGIYGVGWTLANNWTGSYPSDPNERARWQSDGIQPDRLAIPTADGKTSYLDISRLGGSWGNSLVSYLSFLKTLQTGGNITDAGLSSLHSLSETGGVDSLLSNFTSVSDLSNGNVDTRMLGNIASNVIPFSSAQRFVNNINEPNQKDTSGFTGPIAQSIVGLGTTLPDKKDTMGNTIKNPSSMGLSWLKSGENSNAENTDPLSTEIDRLSKNGIEVFPSKQNTNASTDDFSKTVATKLLNDSFYTSLETKKQGEMMKTLLAGAKTKDINRGLSDESKLALTKYTLLGSQKGDAWLSNDINNFADYSLAKYQNETANGTIDKSSTENDDQTIGSLRYNAAAGQILKQLGTNNDDWNSYQSVTKTKFNAMSSDNPVRKALEALDRQLVETGLPSKFQNSKGGYGKSGGSSFTAPTFAAPLTATDATSIKAQSLSNIANPFANIVKTAPATQTNLKRNISIKKGVSL